MDSLILVAEAPWAIEPLRGAGFATLSITKGRHPFVEQLIAAADFAETDARWCKHSVGVFAFGSAASHALDAAAQRPWGIGALVCVDGDSDWLAGTMTRVRAPTLLLVSRPGELQAAGRAVAQLSEQGDRVWVSSTHQAVTLGRAWFARHLGAAQRDPFAPRSSRPAMGAQPMH